ncbi:MAG: SDR family NAD(P)-dependent oxidoreductase [Alphaproteobacteria bacterium]|nr:SDR family NAD(P)-dependent oxidoreductase [Alphaproteobacteria bacterium]
MKRLFVFGMGYTAQEVGRQVRADGWRVAGTCRSAETAEALDRQGFEMFLFDGRQPMESAARALAGTTHLLASVPPDDSGDPVLRAHAGDIASLPGLAWAGYLSTTGIYGDRDGAWVDESTPRSPTTPRGRRRAEAEMAWMGLRELGMVPVHLFRLPGIYGPGRSAIDAVRAGRTRRIFKPGQVFSRIHVDDLAAALIASMVQPRPGAVYNLCDDEPAPPQDVTAYACELLGLPVEPLTPLEEADLSPMARSFYEDSKRVSNERMKRELGVRLAYPTYREGLRAILARQGS